MQVHLTDQVSSATDVDREGIEFDAETDTGETAAAMDGIEKEKLLPSPSIITSSDELKGEHVKKIDCIENGKTPSIRTCPELEGENVIKIKLI